MSVILVVEDDPAMTEGIRDVLGLAGHEVTTAADGRAALDRMRERAPDLILSDVMMPRMDGFAFYGEVRRNPAWTFIPFVFLTALGQREAVTRGKRLGADDYLVKPVDPEQLLATVESRLERGQALSGAAAARLQEMSRLVTGVLGHELRTPITWIRAYAEILQDLRSDMEAEELEAALEGIQSGSVRLARLVEDAVMLVSLDTGQAVEDFRLAAEVDADLPRRLSEIVAQLQPDASRQGIRLSLSAEEELPPVLISPRHLDTMLRHLLDNAIKFSKPTGADEVRVWAIRAPDGLEIVIEDDGVGIPDDHIESIFEPLRQLDRPRHEQQGIGLGLAIARGVVSLHGGRIWAESRSGGPTAVHVVLPAASEAASDGPGAGAPNSAGA